MRSPLCRAHSRTTAPNPRHKWGMSDDEGFRWVLGNDGKAHALMWLSKDETHGGLVCRASVSRPAPAGPTDRHCLECRVPMVAVERSRGPLGVRTHGLQEMLWAFIGSVQQSSRGGLLDCRLSPYGRLD
jgi:hypothetical protein